MKKTCLLAIVASVALSLVLAACTSGGGSTGASTIEELSASVVKVSLDSTSDTIEVGVTINDGESFAVASKLDSGEAEIVSKLPEGESSDYAYEGCGASEIEVAPGTYAVTLKPNNASGVIYILSYPTGKLDFANTDTETLFDQVAEYASSAS